jgi:hypothetical protein
MEYNQKAFDILSKVLISGSPSLALKNLSEDDLKYLERWMPYVTRNVKSVSKLVAVNKRDRMTDWVKLVKDAKKRFSDIDIAILNALGDSEWSYNYDYLSDHVDQPRNIVRLRTRRLIRMGLVSYHRGLFNEDGEVAGSGFSINDKRYQLVQDILRCYEQKNEKLL